MLNFASQILTHTQHLLQPLLKPQLLGSHRNRDRQKPIPPQFKAALLPWLEVSLLQQTEPFCPSVTVVHLWKDASTTGWGSHTDTLSASGLWSPQEQQLQINILEIRAVILTILQLDLRIRQIHLFIDNAPAQFAISKLSAKAPSLLQEVSLLVPLLKERNLTLTAYRISTLLNSKADDLSRQTFTTMDWTLPQALFDSLVNQRGYL